MDPKRITSRIVRSFTVKFDEDLVNNARKDFLSNLRKFDEAMKTPEDASKYKSAIRAYAEKLSKFFYDWLLNEHMKKLSQGVKNEKLSYWANELQKSAWDFHMNFDSLAMDLEDPISESQRYELQPGGSEKLLTIEEAFARKKFKVIARIQRSARAAFKDAFELVQYELKEQSISVAEEVDLGYAYIIPEEGISKDKVDIAIKVVIEATNIIKSAGLGKVVEKKINVHVMNKSKEGLIAAEYYREDDSIHILPLGQSVDTYIHEMGHRWYYQIFTSARRAKWEEVFNEDLLEITESDVDELLALIRKYEPEAKDDITKITEKAIQEYRQKHNGDELAMYKADYFSRNTMFWIHFDAATEMDKLKEVYKDRFVGKKVMKNFISDYGNTNEKEAFADLFKDYARKKQINPLMRYWFELLTGIR